MSERSKSTLGGTRKRPQRIAAPLSTVTEVGDAKSCFKHSWTTLTQRILGSASTKRFPVIVPFALKVRD
jgi:hypothetical protein